MSPKNRFRLINPIKYFELTHKERFFQTLIYLPIFVTILVIEILFTHKEFRILPIIGLMYVLFVFLKELRYTYAQWKKGDFDDDQKEAAK